MFNNLTDGAAGVVVGAIIVLVATALFYTLRATRPNAKPGFQAALDAIQPWVLRAVYAGETIALDGLKRLDVTLSGADKAAIANAIYDTLPDRIWLGPIAISVKFWVSREHFAQLVEDEFRATTAFIAKNETYLTASVDKLDSASRDAPQKAGQTSMISSSPSGLGA